MSTMTPHCWTQSTPRGIPMRGSQRKIPVPQCKFASWHNVTASRLRVLGSKIDPGHIPGTQALALAAYLVGSQHGRTREDAAMTGLQQTQLNGLHGRACCDIAVATGRT